MNRNYGVGEQFVLNGRWIFDEVQDLILDLKGHHGPTALKPVAARILGILVRAPRVLLRRRHLLDEGWRNFGFEVCENSLSQVMCFLRSIFDSLDPGQQYFKTVPRIGYCLLADVSLLEEGHGGLVSAADRGTDFAVCGISSASLLPPFAEVGRAEWVRAGRDAPLCLLMIGVEILRDAPYPGECAPTIEDFAASIVKSLHRMADRVALYGHQEVAVFLPFTPAQGATVVAEKIRDGVIGSFQHLRASTIPAVVSIGMACTAQHTFDTFDSLVAASNAALLKARGLGNNQVVCYVQGFPRAA